eukprot:NODE_123_length_18841_cov_0.279693.p8 type:complete len:216 gc:universal NODE_123_length_18841_cov_0.279693:10513-11160(+)
MLLSQELATKLDIILFQSFSTEALIEVAGQACAIAIQKIFKPQKATVLVGPGNNGNDAIVCARYLKLFGYDVNILIPKLKNQKLSSLDGYDIPVDYEINFARLDQSTLIVDGLLGFSAAGPIREPYKSLIEYMCSTKSYCVSIDVPSGWDVSLGDIYRSNFTPEMLVSLTAPKECTKHYNGIHFVGGRFINPKLQKEFGIHIDYLGGELVKRIDK